MKIFPYIVLLTGLFSCQQAPEDTSNTQKYSDNVGDILFDPTSDDQNFMLCDSTKVISGRSSLSFSDNGSTVAEVCLKNFKFQPAYASFSGYVIVRFIVNCQKETGRFRIQTLAEDFSSKECPLALQNHLSSIVQGLKSWKDRGTRGRGADRSKYINFKITNGKIENVLQ
jgi:hypothetical protein